MTRREGTSRSRIAIAVGVAGLALALFLRHLHGHRPTTSVEPPEARVAQPAAAPEASLASPTVASPAIEPDSAGSARTLAEPTRLVLTYRVLDFETDAPIAGARLRTFEDSAAGTWTTDERGECVVTVPAGARRFRLHVEASGFMHLGLPYWPDPSMALHLARCTTLTGRLLADDTGEALPGASIALPWDDCETATAVADFAGRYELAGVPLHFPETAVVLKAPGFPDETREFELRSDEPRIEQDFRLQRGIEIHGRVVDWVSGAGVAGAHVDGIETDAGGAFRGRLRVDATGPVVALHVAAHGHCELTAPIDSARIGDDLLFRLPHGAVVEGVVRDGSGRPIADASVSVGSDRDELRRRRTRGIAAEPSAGEPLPEGWSLAPQGTVSIGFTDAEGHYRIANVVPWSQVLELSARANGYGDARRAIEAVGGPDEVTEVDVVLEAVAATPETTLFGTLLLNGADFDTARGRVRWKSATHSGEAPIHRGTFDMEVEPGALALDVEVDGLPAGLEGSHVELTSVPESTSVDLRMPTSSITGRVIYADGTAAPDVDVKATCALDQENTEQHGYWEQLRVSGNTRRDGNFALTVPDWDRPYVVEANAPNDRTSVENVWPGAEGVSLALQTPGRLLFRVLDAVSRAPIRDIDLALEWKRADEASFHYWSMSEHGPDADGWREQQFPSGRVDLIAGTRSADHVPRLLEDVLVPASAEPARIELVLARSLRVEVVLAEGLEPPPEGVEILLVEEAYFDQVRPLPETDSWESGPLGPAFVKRFAYFDRKRTCEPGGLGPGRYRFKVEPPDIVVEPESVTLVEGENPPIELRWRYAK